MKKCFVFIGKVLKAAINYIVKFIKDIVNNAAGICLLAGATIGFTKIVIELPFIIAMPLWIESLMVAPIIAVIVVFLLVQLMKIQLSWRGI